MRTKAISITTASLNTGANTGSAVRNELMEMYCKRLKVEKMEFLADGCYASVYEHPTKKNRVIKIAVSSPKYTDYIIWCAHHQDNPYVPKLESIEVFEISSSCCYHNQAVVVVMEKLREVIRTSCHTQDVMSFVDVGYKSESLIKRKQFAKLNELCSAIRDIQGKGKNFIDIHSGNVMRRGSQPVVTDPLVG